MKVKTIFLEKITPFFRSLGYKYIAGANFKFYLKTKEYVVVDSFNYLAMAKKILGGKLNLSINAVEDIMLEIRYPNRDFDYVLRKNEFEITIGDLEGVFDVNNDFDFSTESNIEYYANKVIEYIKGDGQKFIETYSYLPNILKKMDELTAQGKTWQDKGRGILSGALDAQFRGLIISKLCNDNGFDKKINMCDEIFSREQYKVWLPYYEKLKERLKTIEPKYKYYAE